MTDWGTLAPTLWLSFQQTVYMVFWTMLVAGLLGLLLGVALHTTRRGGLLANTPLFHLFNVLVNIVRPIPFIIFITAIGPLTLLVMGTTIGTQSVLFPMAAMATFVIGRIVEQNLVSVDPGVVEAARAMGASRFRIIWSVLIPEALAPLILGYTFIFVAGGRHVGDGRLRRRRRARQLRDQLRLPAVRLARHARHRGDHHRDRAGGAAAGQPAGEGRAAQVTATVRGMSSTIQAIAEAFSRHRFTETYPHLAPDVRWVAVGQETYEGRDAVIATCERTTADLATTTTEFTRFVSVVGATAVAVDVVARYTGADGTTVVVSSCDIYEFDGEAVSMITSYAAVLDT